MGLLADTPDHQRAMQLVLEALDRTSSVEAMTMIGGMVMDIPLPDISKDKNKLYLKLALAATERGDTAFAKHYLGELSLDLAAPEAP